MAIQLRRGIASDLIPNNILPAELAYCLDTGKLVIGDGNGGVNEIETQLSQISNLQFVFRGYATDIDALYTAGIYKTMKGSGTPVTYSSGTTDYNGWLEVLRYQATGYLTGIILHRFTSISGKVWVRSSTQEQPSTAAHWSAWRSIINGMVYRGELIGSNALNLAVEEGYYFIPAGNQISLLGNGPATVKVTKGDVGGSVGIFQEVTGANAVATRAVYNLSLIDQIPFVVYTSKEYVDAQLATKVSIAAMNAALAAKANTADMNTALANKVDKDGSKVLSDNNYTNTDKSKVDLIRTSDSGDKALADNGAYKYPVWCETDYNFNSGEIVVGDGSHKVKRSRMQMDDLAPKTYVDSVIQSAIIDSWEGLY